MVLKSKITKTLSAAYVMVTMPGQAYGLEIWHSNTVWANQGMCAASFTLDSGEVKVQDLHIALAGIDIRNNNVENPFKTAVLIPNSVFGQMGGFIETIKSSCFF